MIFESAHKGFVHAGKMMVVAIAAGILAGAILSVGLWATSITNEVGWVGRDGCWVLALPWVAVSYITPVFWLAMQRVGWPCLWMSAALFLVVFVAVTFALTTFGPPVFAVVVYGSSVWVTGFVLLVVAVPHLMVLAACRAIANRITADYYEEGPRCTICAYSISGMTNAIVCPECGSNVQTPSPSSGLLKAVFVTHPRMTLYVCVIVLWMIAMLDIAQ